MTVIVPTYNEADNLDRIQKIFSEYFAQSQQQAEYYSFMMAQAMEVLTG